MPTSSNPNGLATVLPNAGGGFAVQGREILAGTIVDGHLAANTITAASIAAGTLTATTIANATITDAKMVANTLTSASIATNVIQTVTVPLTSAQLKVLYSAPVQAIAAAGSGKTIVLLGAVFVFTATATQYTDGGTVQLQYDNTVHAGGVSPLTTFANTVIQSASSSIQQMQPAAGTVLASNKGIFVSCDTADFATGTGTANVIITYQVISA